MIVSEDASDSRLARARQLGRPFRHPGRAPSYRLFAIGLDNCAITLFSWQGRPIWRCRLSLFLVFPFT